MPKYVAIKSERSLRRHKAAGAAIQYGAITEPIEARIGWWLDPSPYCTLREEQYKQNHKLRAVYKGKPK